MRSKTTGPIRSGDPLPPVFRLARVAIGALLLLATTAPARAGQLVVGNILTFSTGSTAGDPAGTWTLDDKSFTYLSQSGFSMSGTSQENIRIVDTPGNLHSFTMAGLGDLAPSGTYSLGYRVDIVPQSPFRFATVALDTTHLGTGTALAYKDVFSTFSSFQNAAGGYGSGDLASLTSLNGAPDGPVSLAGSLTQIWVRDTIVLDADGSIDSISNTYTQTVPEIDPTSFASVFSLVVACLAVAERRLRRGMPGSACLAAC